MNITDQPIDSVIPYARNPRNNADAVASVAASIKEYGWQQPIVVDTDNVVIVGHTRLLAARQLGMDTVPVVVADGLTPEQVKAYRLADNRVGENAEWDRELLSLELDDLRSVDFDLSLTGFTDDELAQMDAKPTEGNTDPDEVPEPPADPVTVRGDIWELGEHRLMCGDSTSVDDVDALMGGQKADMVFTDPPYNTGMTAKGNSGSTWLTHFFQDSFSDDEWQDFMSAFCSMYYANMKENTGAYICLDWRRNHELVPHIKRHFELSNIIVWDKVVHGLGSDYKYTYEIINVCKKGKPELDTHQGEREYSDVWHIQRQMGRNEKHATAKPVALVERCLRHASKPNSLCLDLFMGSGTTLIACESLGRVSYGMELSPQYCDVIINRWQDFTGKSATLNGKTYTEVRDERQKASSNAA